MTCESIPPGFERLLSHFLCCYTIESNRGGKPRGTSKPSWKYFRSADMVKMGTSLCRRGAAAGNRNKYSIDLRMGYHSVNGRGSKLRRLQRRLLLLGIATSLLPPKSETNILRHTCSLPSLIFHCSCSNTSRSGLA